MDDLIVGEAVVVVSCIDYFQVEPTYRTLLQNRIYKHKYVQPAFYGGRFCGKCKHRDRLCMRFVVEGLAV